MNNFINLKLVKEDMDMMLSTEHIFSVINNTDYRIVVTDLYDSPNKRKTYKVKDTYESIYDRIMK